MALTIFHRLGNRLGTRESAFCTTAIILLCIAYLSLSPLDELPDAPGGDKLHHLIAYAALALPLSLIRQPGLMIYAIGFVIFGGAIEMLQPFVNRYGEWLDFIANALGVGLGLLLGTRILPYLYARL